MISTWSAAPRASVMPPCRPEVSTASSSMSDRRDRILTEFQQYTSGRRRMDEDVKMPAGADLDLVRNEAHAFALQLFKCCRDVVYMDRHMMQPLATLGDELGNHGILGSSLEKFQAAFARGHERSSNFLVLDDFLANNFHAKLLVKLASFGDALHRDAQMIDLKHPLLLALCHSRAALLFRADFGDESLFGIPD